MKATTTTKLIDLEALRALPPLALHPDVVAAGQAVETTRAALPAARTDVQQAEDALAAIEATEADAAAAPSGQVDARGLRQARLRVEDARSTLRVREQAVLKAQVRLHDVTARVHADLLAQFRAAYQAALTTFDATIAQAAAQNAELAQLSSLARGALSGSADVNAIVHWPPLTGEDARCHYVFWRENARRAGFTLPEASAAHALPAKAPRLMSPLRRIFPGVEGHSTARTFAVPVGPGGMPRAPESTPLTVPFGPRVRAWFGGLTLLSAFFR
jgi:hypothetical protein